MPAWWTDWHGGQIGRLMTGEYIGLAFAIAGSSALGDTVLHRG